MKLRVPLSTLVGAIQRIDRLAAYLGGIVLFSLMLVITYEVALRYLFSRPVRWAFDLSELMLAAIFFLGVAYVMQVDGHVRIEVLTSRLSRRKARALNVITLLTALAYSAVFVWKTGVHALLAIQSGWATWTVSFPLWPALVLLPLAGFFLAMECAIKIVEHLQALRK